MADLLGGTSGQILSKATNADMDFTWINNDQGDITGITATSPLTGGGTSGAITVGIQASSTTQSGAVQLTDSTSSTSTTTAATPNSVKTSYDLAAAAVPKSTVTTAGDVIYATGSSAVTRLGIGTAGQVLTVNGGGTAPSWATPAGGGGMTSIASGSLSGSALSLTSISGSYKNLQLVLRNANTSSQCNLTLTINNNTGANYSRMTTFNSDSTFTSAVSAGSNNTQLNGDQLKSGRTNTVIVDFNDYANTTSYKQWMSQMSSEKYLGSYMQNALTLGVLDAVGAITRIDLTISAGTFSAGTYILYGVN
jgi:hypothetical protein